MARSKIKLTGVPKSDLEILLKECSNNNQICYHINKNNSLVQYLKQETGLDREPMILLYHYRENLKEIPKCVCGKERKYHCYGYRPSCGRKKCLNLIREESKKKFCLENYGVEFVTQLESMKEKSKQTFLERFGVDNCTKSPEVIKKTKEKNLIKYGVEWPISLQSVRSKNLTDSERGIEKIQSGLPKGYKVLESDKFYYYKIICPKGHLFEIGKSSLYLRKKNDVTICAQCNEYKGSSGEQEVFEFVQSIYDKPISRSNRELISPFEIDMVLDDIKLCIEFNGDYWHSINVNGDKYYHFKKLQKCVSLGYDLIQIKENDWNQNKDEIKRKLFNKIKDIYDINDLTIKDDIIIFDLFWFDSKIINCLDSLLIEEIDPQIVKSGQYQTWNCGYYIYKYETF